MTTLSMATTQTQRYTAADPLRQTDRHPATAVAYTVGPVDCRRGRAGLQLLAIFMLGTFLTRSAGCIINDLADRHVDGAVSRTSNRPLVIGTVTEKEALPCSSC